MIADSELDVKRLASVIEDILQTEGKIESMREALGRAGVIDSAGIIADDIRRLIETGSVSGVDHGGDNAPAVRG